MGKRSSREEFAYSLGLPLKIYCTLKSVYINKDGNVTITINKNNKAKLFEYLNKLKSLVGEELYLLIDIGLWSDNSSDYLITLCEE